MTLKDDATLADMLEALGYGRPGNDLDDVLKWVLVEVVLNRAEIMRAYADLITAYGEHQETHTKAWNAAMDRVVDLLKLQGETYWDEKRPEYGDALYDATKAVQTLKVPDGF